MKKFLVLFLTATLTASEAYDASQSGYFLDAQQVTVKIPTATIDPVNFKAPHLYAGCDGIDFFTGSFSIMDGQDYKEYLTTLAQNTLGVMTKMAIRDMMPTLAEAMNNIEDKMQLYNLHSIDSCRLAESIAEPLYSSAKEEASHYFSMLSASENTASYDEKSKMDHAQNQQIEDFWILPTALRGLEIFSQQEVKVLVSLLGASHNSLEKKNIQGSIDLENWLDYTIAAQEEKNRTSDPKKPNLLGECFGKIEKFFHNDSDFVDQSAAKIQKNIIQYFRHLEKELHQKRPLDLPKNLELEVHNIYRMSDAPVVNYINSLVATGAPKAFNTVSMRDLAQFAKRTQIHNILRKLFLFRHEIFENFYQAKIVKREDSDQDLVLQTQIDLLKEKFELAEDFSAKIKSQQQGILLHLQKKIFEFDRYTETKVARKAKMILS